MGKHYKKTGSLNTAGKEYLLAKALEELVQHSSLTTLDENAVHMVVSLDGRMQSDICGVMPSSVVECIQKVEKTHGFSRTSSVLRYNKTTKVMRVNSPKIADILISAYPDLLTLNIGALSNLRAQGFIGVVVTGGVCLGGDSCSLLTIDGPMPRTTAHNILAVAATAWQLNKTKFIEEL